jgi:hypothetical protein
MLMVGRGRGDLVMMWVEVRGLAAVLGAVGEA